MAEYVIERRRENIIPNKHTSDGEDRLFFKAKP